MKQPKMKYVVLLDGECSGHFEQLIHAVQKKMKLTEVGETNIYELVDQDWMAFFRYDAIKEAAKLIEGLCENPLELASRIVSRLMAGRSDE